MRMPQRTMTTDPHIYFAQGCGRCDRFATNDCSTRIWRDGLAVLRDLCKSAGLVETAKWGHPCYMHADRNIAIIGAFRDNFRLSFFNAGLMTDPEGILERQGPNTQNPDMIRFTATDDVLTKSQIIADYFEEAKRYAEQGLTAARSVRQLDWPDELTEALDADPELAEAFHALTPGRQRSYLFNLNSAKKPETRAARIAKFRAKIIAGKGAQER